MLSLLKVIKEDGTLLYKDPGDNGTQSSPSLDSVEVYKYKVCANDVETKLVAQKCLKMVVKHLFLMIMAK